MGKYVLRRFWQSILTVLVVLFVMFMLLRLMPKANYFTREDYINMTEDDRTAYLRNLGVLDHPVVQFFKFVRGFVTGDLGRSITVYPKTQISEILKEKIPYSLWFGLVSVVLSVVFGFLMGISMANNKDKIADNAGTIYVVIVRAIPSLVYLFLIQIWVTGLFRLPMVFYSDEPASWILPAVSLSLSGTAWYAIWLRRFMVDEENKDYIKFAVAKGLPRSYIMKKHVLRNALVPLVQYLPSQILLTIAGSLIIESIYSIPGMGGLLVYAIRQQDNTLVQALVCIYAILGVFGVFLGDILMAFVDPRIKLTSSKVEREVTA